MTSLGILAVVVMYGTTLVGFICLAIMHSIDSSMLGHSTRAESVSSGWLVFFTLSVALTSFGCLLAILG